MLTRKHMKITSAPLTFDLADGSSSVKDYIMGPDRRLNRFSTASTAKKNRIVGPTKAGISICPFPVFFRTTKN